MNSSENHSIVIDICRQCVSLDDAEDATPAGQRLLDDLNAYLALHPIDTVSLKVRGVDCMAVCDRPTTIALRAEGQFSYILGDVAKSGITSALLHDIVNAAKGMAQCRGGVLPKPERPAFFRDGVIGRTFPENFS